MTPRALSLSESSTLSSRPRSPWFVAPLVKRVACHAIETGSIPVRTAVEFADLAVVVQAAA